VGVVLRLRSKQGWQPREWPRGREGGLRDEREWIESLDDRELAQLCAGLGQIDQAVKGFREKPEKPPKRDAA
jgi:hypothetical protein